MLNDVQTLFAANYEEDACDAYCARSSRPHVCPRARVIQQSLTYTHVLGEQLSSESVRS